MSDRLAPMRLDVIALKVLYVLAAVSVLYRVQHYSVFPFAAEYRLMLYALLAMLVLGVRRKLVEAPLSFWALGMIVVWMGVHTYWLSSPGLALYTTARFSNVLALAPMAALLLLGSRQLKVVFHIFLVVFLLAMATLLFQFWGGGLDTLTQGYIAIRGDLIRHMTLVGEPNVGGMLASLVFVLSVTLLENRKFALLWGALAVAFIVFSLSKAAILGAGVGILASCMVYGSGERREVLVRVAVAGVLGLALLYVLGAGDYVRVGIDAVSGAVRGEPSAFEDLKSRQISIDIAAIMGGHFGFPVWLNYLLGASFFNVGSAALELRGHTAGVVLPHNSYLELFLTGGIAMLGLVLFLMARAGLRLYHARGTEEWPVDRCALICLIMLSAWMLVYPVIYEPVTGCLFWIIIGYGNRRRA